MFRFTIRELVLVTALVAMALGWWVDRAHLESERRRFAYLAEVAVDRYVFLFDAVENGLISR